MSLGVLKDRKLPFLFGLETEEGYPHQGLLDFADNTVNATTRTITMRGVIANRRAGSLPDRACVCDCRSARRSLFN
jgi:hypothetical protein